MKIIQILSHKNELYALDDEGNIYAQDFRKDAAGYQRFDGWYKIKNPIVKKDET